MTTARKLSGGWKIDHAGNTFRLLFVDVRALANLYDHGPLPVGHQTRYGKTVGSNAAIRLAGPGLVAGPLDEATITGTGRDVYRAILHATATATSRNLEVVE